MVSSGKCTAEARLDGRRISKGDRDTHAHALLIMSCIMVLGIVQETTVL